MINDSKQESTIIIESEAAAAEKTGQDPCIFCISATPPPTNYKGDCNCQPPIHPECIDAWYAHNLKRCPICLNTPVSNNIVIRTNVYTPKYTLIFATLCCTAICCGPFILIGILFSLYPRQFRGVNIVNTTSF